MTLGQAIEQQLLTPPSFVALGLDRGVRDQIQNELRTDQGSLARFGDYSQTTLGRVWELLAGSREARSRVIKEILQTVRKHDRRRIVVFLPPVGDRLDAFLGEFRQAFEHEYPEVVGHTTDFVHDFRSATTGTNKQSRATFFAFTTVSGIDAPSVLFTINRFSEGVSITDIDMLVMLRATLSPRVAVQSLGRGLRVHEGKQKCIVLDGVFFQELIERWDSPT